MGRQIASQVESGRAEHAHKGFDPDVCSTCGLPEDRHRALRKRSDRVRLARREQRPQHRPYGDPCRKCKRPASEHRPSRDRYVNGGPHPDTLPCVGIDGEGWGRDPHLYTYLSAVDEHRRKLGSIADRAGLGTQVCLDFLLDLRHADGQTVGRVWGYAVGYDWAKILRELSAVDIARLMRPEERKLPGKSKALCVRWRPDPAVSVRYEIDYLRNKWTVRRQRYDAVLKKWRTEAQVVCWDSIAYYASSFVFAIEDWDIGTPEQRARIAATKDERSTFSEAQEKKIQDYCDEECTLLGQLVRKRLQACEAADIRTAKHHGPGSIAAAVLEGWGVKEMKQDPPSAMRVDLSRGYFGGHFEASVCGDVLGPLWSADINSAYPTAMLDLPCLVHGKWTRVYGRAMRGRVERAALALVHCRVRKSKDARRDWGPLPWRDSGCSGTGSQGDIVFPRSGIETWVWREEYLEACKWFCQVEGVEAWVYDTDCACLPFRELSTLYRRRVELGADAAGKAIKLAINSCYGKTVQSIGAAPPFHSLVWAGNITSMTRAMLLSAFGVVKGEWDIVQFATDSVTARAPLDGLPAIETGTGDLKKPLGGWAVKKYEGGIFVCRPGLYFPLDPAEAVPKEYRTRGVGKADFMRHAPEIRRFFHEQWQEDSDGVWFTPPYIIDDAADALVNKRALEKWKSDGKKGPRPVDVKRRPRFHGLKTSTRKRDGAWVLADNFGEWSTPPFSVGFDPHPKRGGAVESGRLTLREDCRGMSTPYDPKVKGSLAAARAEGEDALDEQDD